jgi:predicted RND superfamily exporter protein
MRRAGILVITVIIITMGFITILPDVRIEMDFNAFMPENEVVSAFDEMEEYFGPKNEYYYIFVESDGIPQNILTPRSLREQYNLSIEAADHEGVIDVIGIANLMDDMLREINSSIIEARDRTIYFVLDSFRSLILGEINITGYTPSEFEAASDILLSKDFDPTSNPLAAANTIILIILDPALSASELKQISKDLKSDLNSLNLAEVKLGHTGNHLLTSDIDQKGNENLIMLGIAIVLLVTFVLAFTFRKISYVILPLLTLSIAIIWTFGTMALLGLKFTIIDIAVVPLLLGLGVDYTVHISRRYLFEYDNADSVPTAMSRAQSHIVPAIFLAVLTTTIAFLSNQLSSIQPIREFGLVCAIGIFYAFILTLVFHNAGRVLIDRIVSTRKDNGKRKPHEDTKMVKLAVHTASKSVTWFPVLVITIVGIITSLAFVGAVNVRTEFSETDFLPDDWQSIEVSDQINEQFEAGKYSQVFIFIRDDLSVPQNIATVEMMRQLQQLESVLMDDEYVVKVGGVPRTESILFYIQKILESNTTLKAIYDIDGSDLLPDDSAGVAAVLDILMESEELADPLTGQSYKERMKTLLHRNSDGYYDATKISIFVKAETTAEMESLYNELRDELPDFLETNVIITGNTIMTIVTIDALRSSQINSTILAVILAFVLLAILYRSIGLGLISLVPVVLSTLWILGTMYIFDISLNVLTVMVTALTIGIGLDYTIYIVTRYEEERKKHSIEDAINSTIRGTGSALFISGVTTICGFAVLMISPIPIIAHFGFIIATTIIYCGVLAVVVLPILLVTREKIRMRLKGTDSEEENVSDLIKDDEENNDDDF